MKTRQQYLNKEVSHGEYYGQFVTDSEKARVRDAIGETRLRKSQDPHLNDIPLQLWDRVFPICPASVAEKMKEAGDYPTKSGLVCVGKEAARQLISEEVTV